MHGDRERLPISRGILMRARLAYRAKALEWEDEEERIERGIRRRLAKRGMEIAAKRSGLYLQFLFTSPGTLSFS